jgi:hypothetical protein
MLDCGVTSERRSRIEQVASITSRRTPLHFRQALGELAQLGERLVCNQEVTGSSPVFSTNVLVWRLAIYGALIRFFDN